MILKKNLLEPFSADCQTQDGTNCFKGSKLASLQGDNFKYKISPAIKKLSPSSLQSPQAKYLHVKYFLGNYSFLSNFKLQSKYNLISIEIKTQSQVHSKAESSLQPGIIFCFSLNKKKLFLSVWPTHKAAGTILLGEMDKFICLIVCLITCLIVFLFICLFACSFQYAQHTRQLAQSSS